MTVHVGSRRPSTPEAQRARKQEVLTHGTASAVHGIADALVIKDNNIYFLCRPDGDVPVEGAHGYGLYYDDCRFLRGYELRLAGDLADRLASSSAEGTSMSIELTNPELKTTGNEKVPKERVGLSWHRALDGGSLTLHDTISIENYAVQKATIPIGARFGACFEDVFVVRGLLGDHPGVLHEPRWDGDDLVFAYDGTDGRNRRLRVGFDPRPDRRDGTEVEWEVDLAPHQRRQIEVRLVASVEAAKDGDGNGGACGDGGGDGDGRGDGPPDPSVERRGDRAGANRRREDKPATAEQFVEVRSNSALLEGIVGRSFRDLQILRSDNAGAQYFAAGVPWFVALFGRDSAITAIEALAYDPSVAEQTLRVLAAWQGEAIDDYRDEQPGKILHVLHVGELATTGAVPHHPFYGSVDATPLFCLLMARHAAWTGSLDLFRQLRKHVDAALEWIDRYGDSDGDGFVDYTSSTGRGLVNQGWKDSGNAIVNADGSLATPPIALVEVQGYVFAAKRELADLFERDGDGDRATRLRDEAEQLRRRFEDRFWLDDRQTYAMALQEDGKPCAVVSSNPGQALWTGIVSPDRAKAVCGSLMSDELFSGWGVRTLSTAERRFSPIGYHLGTVWPHDNAIIAAGLRRYGFQQEAERIAEGIVDAAVQFPEYRLPEVFAGYPRSRFAVPVHYPVACHPQAWAAGSVPFLLTTLLGLEPDGFGSRLRIVGPHLPAFADWLELRGVRVASGTCDLRFDRHGDRTSLEVLRVDGDLEVVDELTARR